MTDELRAKFRAAMSVSHPFWSYAFRADGYGVHDDYMDPWVECAWQAWQAAHASRDAEVEALRKDAERYRLLRSCSGYQAPFCVTQNIGHDWIISRREELDEAIDAAMQKGT